MSMIILEGLDGTGKTTLANSISKIKDWPIVNLFDGEDYSVLRNMDIPVEDYHEDIYFHESWLQLGRPSCILDRSIISGYTYNASIKSLRALEYWIGKSIKYKNEILIFHLKAENETVYKRDEDWEGRDRELFDLRHRFNHIMWVLSELKGFDVKEIQTDSKSKKKVLREAVECL